MAGVVGFCVYGLIGPTNLHGGLGGTVAWREAWAAGTNNLGVPCVCVRDIACVPSYKLWKQCPTRLVI